MKRITLALLLLAVALAGCIGSEEAEKVDPRASPDPTNASDNTRTGDEADTGESGSSNATASMAERANVSQIPAELAEIRPFNVTVDDGVTLRGHVYLPEGEGPFATVLLLTPYYNTGSSPDSDDLSTEGGLLEAGFAVAAVNVRGTGLSDGCVRYGGPQAVEDAGRVVEALAGAPFSDGSVGMFGASYLGKTQYMAVASGAPSLEAVVPISAVQEHWNFLTRWGASTGYDPMQRYILYRSLDAEGPRYGRDADVRRDRLECPAYVSDERAVREALLLGDRNAWLEARDYRAEIQGSDVPMLVTNGLTDGEFHILQVEGLWDRMEPEGHLILGQWGHGFPNDYPGNWTRTFQGWLDHHLRDGPRNVEPGLVEFQDGTGAWHNAAAWPPAEADLTPLYLSEGSLVQDPDAVEASEQAFVTDDLRRPDPRVCPDNVALYATPPLAEDVLVAGNVFVNLTLTSTQPDENIAARLWTGDGLPSCPGGGGELTPHRYALGDLYHRGHRTEGEPFPVGEPGVMEMRSVPTAEVLPEGSRLMLAVGAGHPFVEATGAETVLTLHTGPDVLGELWLPVVEGELVFEAGGNADSGEALEVAS